MYIYIKIRNIHMSILYIYIYLYTHIWDRNIFYYMEMFLFWVCSCFFDKNPTLWMQPARLQKKRKLFILVVMRTLYSCWVQKRNRSGVFSESEFGGTPKPRWKWWFWNMIFYDFPFPRVYSQVPALFSTGVYVKKSLHEIPGSYWS